MITLSKFKRQPTASGIRLSCDAYIDGTNELVYFDIEGPEEKLRQITPDPSSFLIGMLIAGMERGEDIHVDGNVPGTFLHHINAFLVPFLIACWPSRHHIKVTAATENEWANKAKGAGAMTGLSCGIDSMYTLLEYSNKNLPAAYRLKSFAVFDVGAFGEKVSEISKARRTQVENNARAIVDQLGSDFYKIRSNIRSWHSCAFPKSVTVVNCACALTLADVCDSYLPASASAYATFSMLDQKTDGIDNADAILLPLISSNRLEIFSSGAGTDRFQKTINLLDQSPYLNKLTPCVRINPLDGGGKNCGTCAKCGQLLLIAEAEGKLDTFEKNFDIAAYQRRKWRVCQRITTMAWAKNFPTTNSEAIEFVRKRGVKFPTSALFASFVLSRLHRIAPNIFKVAQSN